MSRGKLQQLQQQDDGDCIKPLGGFVVLLICAVTKKNEGKIESGILETPRTSHWFAARHLLLVVM